MTTERTVTMRLSREEAPVYQLTYRTGRNVECAACGDQAAFYEKGWTCWEWDVAPIARGCFYLCPPCQSRADEAHSRGEHDDD